MQGRGRACGRRTSARGTLAVRGGIQLRYEFEHLLLPIEQGSRRECRLPPRRLTPRSSLTPNCLPLRRNGGGRRRGRWAPSSMNADAFRLELAGELAAAERSAPRWKSSPGPSPAGVGRGYPLAPADCHRSPRSAGRTADRGWLAWQGDKSTLNTSVASRRYPAGTIDQTSSVASLDLQRRLTTALGHPRWLRRLDLRERLGACVEDPQLHAAARRVIQRPRTSGSAWTISSRGRRRGISAGIFVRANLNGAAGGFRLLDVRRASDPGPDGATDLTEIPWLQPMLDRLGLAADTPQQLADLLRTNAELSAYGIREQPSTRRHTGANSAWARAEGGRAPARVGRSFPEHALQPRRLDRPALQLGACTR